IRIGGFARFSHHSHEADPLAGQSADQSLLFSVVAKRGARRIDPGCQRRLRHNAPAPNGIKHIVLSDDALAVADEVYQKIKDLGLDRDYGPSPAQFTAIRIQNIVFKREKHILPADSFLAYWKADRALETKYRRLCPCAQVPRAKPQGARARGNRRFTFDVIHLG